MKVINKRYQMLVTIEITTEENEALYTFSGGGLGRTRLEELLETYYDAHENPEMYCEDKTLGFDSDSQIVIQMTSDRIVRSHDITELLRVLRQGVREC